MIELIFHVPSCMYYLITRQRNTRKTCEECFLDILQLGFGTLSSAETSSGIGRIIGERKKGQENNRTPSLNASLYILFS